MAFLNSIMPMIGAVTAYAPTIVAPDKMWHLLILQSFSFIVDYGWRIVVFTILLKLVLSPLDFFQRYKMVKNQRITERLKPTMEKLQRQYGDDKQKLSQVQMELNRKEGYSYFSSCLPMIVTMVVFITLWLSMQTIAQYMTFKEYVTLYDEYSVASELAETEKDEATAQKVAQDVVYKLYYDGIDQEYVKSLRETYDLSDSFVLEDKDKVQAGFLWIQNIWAPDVPWGDKAILTFDEFTKSIRNYQYSGTSGLPDEVHSHIFNADMYNRVMAKLLNEPRTRTNGYLILPILVVLLSIGSQVLSSYQQKKAGQTNAKGGMATSMKVMMFIMPAMMAVFAIQYASIFTLYMVTNSAFTLVFNLLSTAVIKYVDKRRHSRHYGIATGSTRGVTVSNNSAIIHYVKGANPNAGARVQQAEASADVASDVKSDKKQNRKKTAAVKRSGRPDPNELMNYNMNNSTGKKK